MIRRPEHSGMDGQQRPRLTEEIRPMFDCLVLGDSIAQGLGQFRSECVTIAQKGITSENYVTTMMPGPSVAGTVVISLGVNDGGGAPTEKYLRLLRANVRGRAVIWLLPGIKEDTRRLIRRIAAEHHDQTLDTRAEAGPDHLHPTGQGYIRLAEITRRMAQPSVPATRFVPPQRTASILPR
jgi:hypothetical protein